MSADNTHFAAGGRTAKLPVGPTAPKPSPVFPMADAVALNAVIRSIPIADKAKTDKSKVAKKIVIKTMTPETTSSFKGVSLYFGTKTP